MTNERLILRLPHNKQFEKQFLGTKSQQPGIFPEISKQIKSIPMGSIFVYFIALICLLYAKARNHTEERQLSLRGCSVLLRNPVAVKTAASHAHEMLQSWDSQVPIKDRLAIMMLFSRGFAKQDNNRLEWLRCALTQLRKHLLPQTPSDIYIWTLNSTANPITTPTWLTPEAFPRVNIIAIPEETWKVPCELKPDSDWAVRRHFDIDYYLMGRWRLAFSPEFAREMGYEFHLQFDDDAVLLQSIPYNIVTRARNNNIDMGVFSDLIGEVAHLVVGLPELTYFWMKLNRFTVQGALLKHVKGNTLANFLTEGWDRMYHPGYFLMVSLGFWFRSDVQDYLTTVMRSGKDIEMRWQEQAVMNMMRLVFVPEERVWVMQEVDIGHDRHKKGNFESWCVKTGAVPGGV